MDSVRTTDGNIFRIFFGNLFQNGTLVSSSILKNVPRCHFKVFCDTKCDKLSIWYSSMAMKIKRWDESIGWRYPTAIKNAYQANLAQKYQLLSDDYCQLSFEVAEEHILVLKCNASDWFHKLWIITRYIIWNKRFSIFIELWVKVKKGEGK